MGFVQTMTNRTIALLCLLAPPALQLAGLIFLAVVLLSACVTGDGGIGTCHPCAGDNAPARVGQQK